ncbi:glycosyltransferase family 4 protein [Nostocaceae cyanobacterium CENA369]|uniref:Glycosyltransferase family 4 protein n=1 Tax=Dendronalium phyllosphericum CENA369 TaxID=1725256 RepID=A0A8J7HWJ6_9NOST|nr:glycosyltransferase family 4 protein [Dendronalium phyllosphericum]MBH8571531.1 glycosyltransferase family 4 protein [Dendronalium phyllosphericum CENA369]
MKLLILHNRYRFAGGEDRVVQAEKRLLEANGHEVILLEENNHSIVSVWDTFVAAGGAIYSFAAKNRVEAEIRRFCPEIVHVHNFFPLLSPAVYDACYSAGVPVVQTLHNYRLACPKAMPFRDGNTCEDCIGKLIPWSSVVHACYRNSHLQSSVVATMSTWHRLQGTWQKRVNAYIVFTHFQKQKMVQARLPPEKIYIKPNFVFHTDCVHKDSQYNNYILFVGRLSEEKGVSLLIDAYVQNNLSIPLKIVGDGPLRLGLQAKVQNAGFSNLIEFLGFQDQSTVFQLMHNAKFLVIPSIWYEAFPLTIVEAFACSLPVLAPKLGSMAEIVEDGVNGLHFEARNPQDLAAKINWAIKHSEVMGTIGKNARSTYELKYTSEANYNQLIKIYQEVIDKAKFKLGNKF